MLNPGVNLVKGGLSIGPCGEDCIFVLMVNLNSLPLLMFALVISWLVMLEWEQFFLDAHFLEEGEGVAGETVAASGTSR